MRVGWTIALLCGLFGAACLDSKAGSERGRETNEVADEVQDPDEVTNADGAGDDTPEVVGDGVACGAGGLVCTSDEMCVGTGQGACMGPPPDANGSCGPNCSPYQCGGFEMVCLCAWYVCDPLPRGCDDCSCALQAGHSSCLCDDSSGRVVLSCPGA